MTSLFKEKKAKYDKQRDLQSVWHKAVLPFNLFLQSQSVHVSGPSPTTTQHNPHSTKRGINTKSVNGSFQELLQHWCNTDENTDDKKTFPGKKKKDLTNEVNFCEAS